MQQTTLTARLDLFSYDFCNGKKRKIQLLPFTRSKMYTTTPPKTIHTFHCCQNVTLHRPIRQLSSFSSEPLSNPTLTRSRPRSHRSHCCPCPEWMGCRYSNYLATVRRLGDPFSPSEMQSKIEVTRESISIRRISPFLLSFSDLRPSPLCSEREQ